MILLGFTQTALNNKRIEPNIVYEAENVDLPILNCEKYVFVKVVMYQVTIEETVNEPILIFGGPGI